MRNQDGLTLLEVVMGILVLSLGVAAMIRALDQTLKGQARARNDMIATTLVRGKLDEVKDYSRNAALSGHFRTLTSSALFKDYGNTTTPQVAIIGNRAFTWQVTSQFISMTSGTANVAPAGNTTFTKAIRLVGAVFWSEQKFPRAISQTVIVSDPSQTPP